MVSDVVGEGAAGSEVDPRRALWRRGSYEIVGDWLASASLTVLDAVLAARSDDAGFAGVRLLDIATGTGNVAIDAARRGAEVTAIDLTDELLEMLDANGDGAIARHLLVDHLATFADPSEVGVTLRADYQTSVLRRTTRASGESH